MILYKYILEVCQVENGTQLPTELHIKKHIWQAAKPS